MLMLLLVGKFSIKVCFQKLFKVDVKTNFSGCSSRGGKNSDSDFLVPAWNFANNFASLANFPQLIEFFRSNCPPGTKREAVW